MWKYWQCNGIYNESLKREYPGGPWIALGDIVVWNNFSKNHEFKTILRGEVRDE